MFFDIRPYCNRVKMHNKKMPVLRYQEYLLDAASITKTNFFEALYLWKPHTSIWMVRKMSCKRLFRLHKQNKCSGCFLHKIPLTPPYQSRQYSHGKLIFSGDFFLLFCQLNMRLSWAIMVVQFAGNLKTKYVTLGWIIIVSFAVL